jgi:hypothetical protein
VDQGAGGQRWRTTASTAWPLCCGPIFPPLSALAALASNHKPAALAAAGDALAASGAAPHAFALMEDLTRALLAAGGGGGGGGEAEPWVADCTELMLDAWSSVLTPQCGYAMAPVGPPPGAAGAAARAFAALVDASLADAAAGAHEVGAWQGWHARGRLRRSSFQAAARWAPRSWPSWWTAGALPQRARANALCPAPYFHP